MEQVFLGLRTILTPFADRLRVEVDDAQEYTLLTQKPSPQPQHKGQPLHFAQVRSGKAYVSFHLMPLYMDDDLQASVAPVIQKRKQGKTCFNFKKPPSPEEAEALAQIARACFDRWDKQGLI